MLITKIVKIKWSGNNRKWYEEKGYEFTKYKDEFECKVEDVSPKSTVEITELCDYCLKDGIETIITKPYCRYTKEDVNSIINTHACSKCSSKKLKDVKNKKQELGLLTPSDNYYWHYHENRLKELKKYIDENKTLNSIFNNNYNSLLQSIYTYKENILDMVSELGYNILDVCNDLGSFSSSLKLEHVLNIFKYFINKNNKFPTNNEIYNKLKLTHYVIMRFGGLKNIKDILNIDDRNKIDKINRIDFYEYKNKSGIYKIINLCENKVYIGQAQDLWDRIRGGYFNTLPYNKNHNIHLQRAWNKYGEENFTIEIIELCEIKDLDKKEQYWIDYYKSYDNRMGYNICKEASSCRGVKNSQKEIERKRKFALEHNPMKGKHHTQEVKDYISKIKSIAVVQLNLEGNVLKEWVNAMQIANFYHVSPTSIRDCCNGKKDTFKNYIFLKKEDYENGNYDIQERTKLKAKQTHHLAKSIYQINKETNEIIKAWNSISEASKSLGIKKCTISACLNKRQKTSGGYKWKYKNN